jgi:hypothetical protein
MNEYGSIDTILRYRISQSGNTYLPGFDKSTISSAGIKKVDGEFHRTQLTGNDCGKKAGM